MGGMLSLGVRIFIAIMLFTCWRELMTIAMHAVKVIADLFIQMIDFIGTKIEEIAAGRRGS